MSLVYADAVHIAGQSNASALFQGLVANAMPAEVFVAGAAVGGARLANDTWLSLAEPWTRATYYDAAIARHNGGKYKRLVSVFFQGESDTETDPLSLAHQAKVEAYHEFLAADLLATDGVLYEIILLPWNTSTGTGTGYTNVRAGLLAYVAESPTTRIAIDTDEWGRSGDNVHLTPAQVLTNAPTIIAAIIDFLTRTASSEGGSSNNSYLVLSSPTPDAEGMLTLTCGGISFRLTPVDLASGSETGSRIILLSSTPDAEGMITLQALGVQFRITPIDLA